MSKFLICGWLLTSVAIGMSTACATHPPEVGVSSPPPQGVSSAPPQAVEATNVSFGAAIAEDLRQRFQVDITSQPIPAGSFRLAAATETSRFYDQRGYQPAWLSGLGLSTLAGDLLKALAGAEHEGLRPQDYHLVELRKLADRLETAAHFTAGQWADLDLLLTDAWMTYGTHLLAGRLDPRKAERGWGMEGRSRDLVPVLQDALTRQRIGEALADLAPTGAGYAGLRTELARYLAVEKAGGWPRVSPGPRLEHGARGVRVQEVSARLRASGDLSGGSGGVYDETLAQAVRRFQHRHGLPEDGAVGADTVAAMNAPVSEQRRQIELNMERWRWLPDDLGTNRYILVNITNYTLSVMEEGRAALTAKVIVGKSERPTPAFAASMSYMVFNPRWYVPPTIALKDKLPKLRRNAYALAGQRIRVFDTRIGREIDPGRVNWSQVGSSNFHYNFRQDPGERNALGKVKFMFPNPHDVYIHDTPTRNLFERDQRMFSSGCIRLAKPIELAEYLLKDNPRWTREAIVAATKGKSERVVNLAEKIPVYLVYWTAWIDETGALVFRNDIYSRDERLAKQMGGVSAKPEA